MAACSFTTVARTALASLRVATAMLCSFLR
jgi:hypothetical protein